MYGHPTLRLCVDGVRLILASFINLGSRMFRKVCITCNTPFETNHPKHINCSPQCNNIYRVNQRYERDNHNWDKYYKHILSTKKDHSLTVAELIGKTAAQNYRCALSGIELTCYHKRGEIILTNASIDRINAGKEYNYDNIQIVCRAINSFRGNMEVEQFINWCKKVTENAIRQQKKTSQERVQTAARKG